jgi:hypothetical protein
MKKLIWVCLLLLLLLSAFLSENNSHRTDVNRYEVNLDSFRLVSKHVDENERCFRCHDKPAEMSDPGKIASFRDSLKLKGDKIITRKEFYSSNHKSLACIGCHADPTPEAPDRTSREAAASKTCNDCHQYIKEHAGYHFASIEAEFKQSIHYQKKQSEFSCWKCHDPHKYKTVYRHAKNIFAAVDYDNAICLSCHKHALASSESDLEKMNDKSEMHRWLPEMEEHFEGVRCLDCHTKINKDVLVSHLVLPKETAVKKCGECHSQNSILLTTLYKNQPRDSSVTNALFNSVVKKNIYVMGANRSNTLNKICLSLLGLIFCGLLMHLIPRILTKKKS